MFVNGPKYIIPCQRRFTRRSNDKTVKFEYEKIPEIVKDCLNRNQMSLTDERAQRAFPELEDLIRDIYSKPLSRRLRRRARCEHKIVKRLQQAICQRPDIIICRVDKNPGFYIGKAATIASKAQEYMTTTEAYEEMSADQSPLSENFNAVTKLLNYLLKEHTITEKQYDKLSPNIDKIELAHLHCLPKIHKPDTPIRPIIAGIHAPTALLSKFLNNLLAPIYLQVARETTFLNSIDVVRKLETYAANGHFKSTTYFITADVKNLYTTIRRNDALYALMSFLEKYSHQRKIGTFRIDHIMKMARVILDNNCFVYQNKYYKQIRGGAMGSAFTQVLANIYMLQWEQNLIKYQETHQGIYGRYIDDILLVTNEPLDEIKQEIERVQKSDTNIEIETTVSTSINYLDAILLNENGQLKTMIYHKPTNELYYLPYTSDHPHQYHRNIPYNAMIRAARLCSNVNDFNQERLRIEMSLLLSNYPPQFISNQFLRFFHVNNAALLLKQLDHQIYQHLHKKLLYQASKRKKPLNHSIQHLVQNPPVLQQKIWDPRRMNIKYEFQSGPIAKFSHEFYQWWHKHYKYPGSPVNQVQLRFIPKTNRTLATFYIHKKPERALLTRMEPKQ